MEFTDWYKKIIDDSQVDPPESLWNSISDELDINESWHIIDRRLTWNRFLHRGKKLTIYSTAAVLLVFVGFKLFINPESFNRQAKPLMNLTSSKISKKENFSNHTKIYSSNKREPDNSINTYINSNKPILSNRELDKISQLERDNLDLYVSIPEIEKIINAESFYTSKNIEFYDDTSNTQRPLDSVALSKLPGFTMNVSSKDNEEQKVKFINNQRYLLLPKGLSFGAMLGYYNTWILNQDTYNGLNKNELNSTRPYYDFSYGIIAGWNISDKIGLDIRINFVNIIGQKYNEYRQGKYVPRSIEINYNTNTFLMSYKQAFYLTPKILSSRNYLIGLNYGRLNKSEQIVNGKSEDISNLYNDKNISIDIGYQYDMYLFNHFVISTGIDVNYGLINIWKGNDFLPSNFNDTRTGSIGFFISAKYFIPFTIK
jgi:hypothetical protein